MLFLPPKSLSPYSVPDPRPPLPLILTTTYVRILRYIAQPNCIILAVSAANNDLAVSDAIALSQQVDPKVSLVVSRH